MGAATMIYEACLYLFFISAAVALSPRGCNVCYKEETIWIQRNYSIRERHNLIVRDNKPCSALQEELLRFQWCKDFHMVEQEKTMAAYCCEGYEIEVSDLRCKPICHQGCFNGKCIEPDKCQCQHGWRGEACNSTCPPDKWGPGCVESCSCENGGTCDVITGICDCTKGWRGRNCSEPCHEGYHGDGCREECQCQNNANCDPISGRCNCTHGYRGPLCEEKCENGTHGYQCSDECKCQNNAVCHHVDGSCECPAGLTGPVCADKCKEENYGPNCAEICHCYNNGICDPISGRCSCPPGFNGESCEFECPIGTWGFNCSQQCDCKNGYCNSMDGTCKCFEGFKGTDCDERECPSRRWGFNCSNECSCEEGVECHPKTGECWCLSENEDCSIPLKEFFEKQVMEKKDGGEINIWEIISMVCISVILLQIIVVAAIYYRKRSFSTPRDSSLLPSYSQLTKDEHQ